MFSWWFSHCCNDSVGSVCLCEFIKRISFHWSPHAWFTDTFSHYLPSFFFCLCFTLRNRRGNSAGNQNSCHLIRYIARFNQRIFFMHVFVLLSSRLWVRYVWMFTHPLAVKLLSGVQCSLWPTLLSGGFGCCESSLAFCNLFKRCLKIMFPGCKRK